MPCILLTASFLSEFCNRARQMKELHTHHTQTVRRVHLKFLIICGCFMDHLLLSSGSTLRQIRELFNSTEKNTLSPKKLFLNYPTTHPPCFPTFPPIRDLSPCCCSFLSLSWFTGMMTVLKGTYFYQELQCNIRFLHSMIKLQSIDKTTNPYHLSRS